MSYTATTVQLCQAASAAGKTVAAVGRLAPIYSKI